MIRLEAGQTIKGAVVLQQVESLVYRRFKMVCPCGTEFVTDSRAIKRNKELLCDDCHTVKRVNLIKVASKKKTKWVEPEYRNCNSCYETKPKDKFPPNRNTCKSCHNIGRGAYYHMSKKD